MFVSSSWKELCFWGPFCFFYLDLLGFSNSYKSETKIKLAIGPKNMKFFYPVVQKLAHGLRQVKDT